MSYYVNGYETPSGVNSREEVRRMQASLGVTADGIWGPRTQAAYDAQQSAMSGASSSKYGIAGFNIQSQGPAVFGGGSILSNGAGTSGTGAAGGAVGALTSLNAANANTANTANTAKTAGAASGAMSGTSSFNDYYSAIMGAMSVPSVSVAVPTRAELSKEYEAILRPNVDYAIKNRREAGETAKAELDADAAARGMGASTYLSSMKEREGDDVEEDVSYMEAQYTAALAERIAEAMQYYTSLKLEADMTNARLYADAASNAMSMAGNLYESYLSSLGTKKGGSSGSGNTGKTAVSAPLSQSQYLDYISMLSSDERDALFFGSSSYWKAQRAEIRQGLGSSLFADMMYKYADSDGGKAGLAWQGMGNR